MTENELSHLVIGAAIEVHKVLGGPGLLEDIYEEALCQELHIQGVKVNRQVGIPLTYKGKQLKKRLVLDVLVGEKLIVETKSVEQHNPLFEAQLLIYLRLTDKRLGLVLNFGQAYLKDGVYRVVNNL